MVVIFRGDLEVGGALKSSYRGWQATMGETIIMRGVGPSKS